MNAFVWAALGLCLAEGFHRSFGYSVAIVAAVMSWIGGLVFARFLGRWV